MAKVTHEKESGYPFLKTLFNMATTLIGGVKPLVEQIQEKLDGQLDHYAQIVEKRLIVLALRGSAFLMSLLFIGVGFLFVLIDYGGIPRGIACLGCGLFGLIMLFFLVQFTKQN